MDLSCVFYYLLVIRVSFSSSIYTVNETDGLVFVFIDVFGSTELNLQPFFMTVSGTARGLDNFLSILFYILVFCFNTL